MAFYLTFFIINILLGYIADKSYKTNKPLLYLALGLVVAIHTIVLGCRDFGVGTDTLVYIDYYFNTAHSINNLHDFLTCDDIDYGFLFLAWICAQFSLDAQSLLIGTELTIILFMLLGMMQYRKIYHIPIWMMMTLYCFMFCLHTMNMMRQGCAMSILFFAFSFFLRKKYKWFIILYILAFTFHSTAIFFSIVPGFYYISQIKKASTQNVLIIGVFVSLVLVYVAYFAVISLIGNMGIISEVYMSRYGAGSEYIQKGTSSSSLRVIIMTIYMILLLFYANKRNIFTRTQFVFYLLLYITMSVFVSYFPRIIAYTDRIGRYITIIMIVYYALILKEKRIPLTYRLLFFVFSIIFDWYTTFFIFEGAEVVPFTSKILGI